jgi:hypothetical protein
VVIVRLKKTLDPDHAHELHRLLGTLFLPEIEFKEKSEILEEEFHIQMEDDRKEMLGTMCNLSQGIKGNAMQQGLQQGTQQARIETVENMIRANIPEQTIRSMGYTEEELSSAKQNISLLV